MTSHNPENDAPEPAAPDEQNVADQVMHRGDEQLGASDQDDLPPVVRWPDAPAEQAGETQAQAASAEGEGRPVEGNYVDHDGSDHDAGREQGSYVDHDGSDHDAGRDQGSYVDHDGSDHDAGRDQGNYVDHDEASAGAGHDDEGDQPTQLHRPFEDQRGETSSRTADDTGFAGPTAGAATVAGAGVLRGATAHADEQSLATPAGAPDARPEARQERTNERPLYREADNKAAGTPAPAASTPPSGLAATTGVGAAAATAGTGTAAAGAAGAATQPSPTQTDLAAERAQARAERDRKLGKREKASEPEAVRTRPSVRTTDKAHGALALFLLRLVVAAIMGMHGLQKLLDIPGTTQFFGSTALRDIAPEAPMYAAWAAGIGEVLIAVGLLVGFLTRAAGLFTAVVAVSALVLVKWLTNPIHLSGEPGFTGELDLLLAVCGILFLLLGAGAWSLDGALRRRRAARKART